MNSNDLIIPLLIALVFLMLLIWIVLGSINYKLRHLEQLKRIVDELEIIDLEDQREQEITVKIPGLVNALTEVTKTINATTYKIGNRKN